MDNSEVVIPYDPSVLERMQRIEDARRLTPEQRAAKAKLLALVERAEEAVGIRSQSKPTTIEAVLFLDGRVRVGEETFQLGDREKGVLQALVKLGAATMRQLERESGWSGERAVRTLRQVRRKYPALAPFIMMAVKPNSGGYRTTIKQAPV